MLPPLFYLRAIHRWEQPNITRYYGELAGRPSIARVVEEARPYRELFPLPGRPTRTCRPGDSAPRPEEEEGVKAAARAPTAEASARSGQP